MFRNKLTCPNCSQRIDALMTDCPYCHTHNEEYDKMHLSKHALNPAWYFQLIIFIFGWMGFQVIATIVEYSAAVISGVPLAELTDRIDILGPVEFIAYFILFIGMCLFVFFSKSYKKLPSIFKDWRTYVFGLAGLGATIVLGEVWEMISGCFTDATSNNQSLVVKIAVAYPILSIIIMAFVGPVCEELTYRVGLFGLIRRWNRVAAYLISIFVFAAIHFDISSLLTGFMNNDWAPFINELWNFPSYLIAGGILVATYDLFGFGASTFAHVLNNLLGILAIIYTYYVGK